MSAPLRMRRWTRQEYDRLVEVGVLHEDEPVELIGGQLIVTEPKGTRYATAVRLAAHVLQAAFGEGWLVVVQDPIALDDDSEPEPDVAVVPGALRDYRDAHPSWPALILEVAESSLMFDRHAKASLYARASLIEYWIVDLAARTLEVHREPVPDASARFGWRYGAVQVLREEMTASPLARPDVVVAVADLLP